MFDLNPDGGTQTVTLKLDATNSATLSTLIRMGIENGDPLLGLAANRLGCAMRDALMTEIGPELALEAIDEAIEALPEDAPLELRDHLRDLRRKAEAAGEEPEITEAEIDDLDLDELAEQLTSEENDS